MSSERTRQLARTAMAVAVVAGTMAVGIAASNARPDARPAAAPVPARALAAIGPARPYRSSSGEPFRRLGAHGRDLGAARPRANARVRRSRHRVGAPYSRRVLALIARERPRAARLAAARRDVARPAIFAPGSRSAAPHARRAHAAADQAAQYEGTITDLGTLGGASSLSGGIDAGGDVTGDSQLAEGANQESGGADHAFFGAVGTSGLTDLGSLRATDDAGNPITGNSLAKAINPNGNEIAGWSESELPPDAPDDPQSFHAAIWTSTPSGWTAEDLGTLLATAGSDENGTGCRDLSGLLGRAAAVSWATGVNNDGTVVGIADTHLEPCPEPGSTPDDIFPFFGHAFASDGQSMRDLGTLDNNSDPSQDCAFSQADAINGSGAVVGFSGSETWGGWGTFTGGCSGNPSSDPNLLGHGFLLRAGSGPGSMIDLGEPAGGTGENNYSEATAINASGDIAMDAVDSSGVSHGYVRRIDPLLGLQYIDVGTLGRDTRLHAINSHDQAVGESYTATGQQHAVLYVAGITAVRNGMLVDLNSLLPADSPWTLLSARAINDSGQIAGWGVINGQVHAFRMTISPLGAEITAGPRSRTRSQTATFYFSAADQSDFECSLDGAQFDKCTLPKSYSGLEDGSHVFQVRVHEPGLAPSKAVSWTWTIDTQPPVVAFDSAPSGSDNGPDATFTFESDKPNVTFTCQLDGEDTQACASPYSLTGLTSGNHQMTITATDALGNVSTDPAVATWSVAGGGLGGTGLPPGGGSAGGGTGTVSGTPGTGTDGSGGTSGPGPASPPPPSTPVPPPPATVSCPAGSQAKASSGLLFVVGRSGTCLTRDTYQRQQVWKAAGTVTVNGILLTPDPGTFLALGNQTLDSSGGVTAQLGSLDPSHIADGVHLRQDLAGALDVVGKPVSAGLLDQMGGLQSVVPWPSITLSSDDGGSAAIGLTLNFPNWLTALPGEAKGLSAGFTVNASNDLGTSFAGRISIAEAWFGYLGVKDLQVSYDWLAHTWVGQVGLLFDLGDFGKSPELLASITFGPPPAIWKNVRAFSVALQGLDIPLGDTGAFLQKLGVSASQGPGASTLGGGNYLTLTGTAGLSAGPKIKLLGDVPALSFDGTESLSPFSDPLVFKLSGTASLVNYPIGGPAQLTLTGPTAGHGWSLQLTGAINLTLGGYGVIDSIDNVFFTASQFNLGASGTLQLPGLGSAKQTAVFSDNGVAACAGIATRVGTIGIGFGWNFHDGTVSTLDGACDMQRYSDTITPHLARAASAAGSSYTLQLTASSQPRLIAIHGASAAPQITLSGPGGVSLATGPDGSGNRSADGLVMPDAANDTTYVLLAGNQAGTYTIVSADQTITSIQTADSRPPVDPQVRTRALRGGKRLLTYSQTPAPGQTLELYEEGSGGTGRLLLTTGRSHGQITYRPAPGIGNHRHILAVTIADGLPRDRRSLAPYTIADGPPAKIRHLARHGAKLTWKAPARAVAYAIALTKTNRAQTSRLTRKTAVILPPGIRTATIEPLDTLDRPGPATTINIPPAPKPKHKPPTRNRPTRK